VAQARTSIGNRIAPARFLLFLALLLATYLGLRAAGADDAWDAMAMAFDGAALVFLASLIPLLRDATPESMRAAAKANDANRVTILVLTTVLTVVALAAIAGQMDHARAGNVAAIMKLIGTLLLVWLFANSVYALHYAHMYYSPGKQGKGDAGGLEFPGTASPTYGDFGYFAFTLAMTFQTSDVAIRSPAMRHVALFHCFGAFLFNIGLIGFTISVLGGSSS
jgi:uncharacterized membrane protein